MNISSSNEVSLQDRNLYATDNFFKIPRNHRSVLTLDHGIFLIGIFYHFNNVLFLIII